MVELISSQYTFTPAFLDYLSRTHPNALADIQRAGITECAVLAGKGRCKYTFDLPEDSYSPEHFHRSLSKHGMPEICLVLPATPDLLETSGIPAKTVPVTEVHPGATFWADEYLVARIKGWPLEQFPLRATPVTVLSVDKWLVECQFSQQVAICDGDEIHCYTELFWHPVIE